MHLICKFLDSRPVFSAGLSISGQTWEVGWLLSTWEVFWLLSTWEVGWLLSTWVDWLLFTRSFLPMYELNNSKGIEIPHWNYILVMHVNKLGITSHWFPKKYVTVETAWKCYKRCWLLAFLLLIQWLWIKITHWNYILVMHVNRLGITSHWFPKKYVTVETAWKYSKSCGLLASLLLIQWLWKIINMKGIP